MKSTNKTFAAGTLFFALAGTGVANADISVNLNGQPLTTSVSPMQVGGRTLVPMRDIFEALGAKLTWNPVAQTITAQKDLTTIQLAIDNPNALVNNHSVPLDQPATLINGRTFVPLRFVAEATGAKVDWNSSLQLVSIQDNSLGVQPPVLAQNPVAPPALQPDQNPAYPPNGIQPPPLQQGPAYPPNGYQPPPLPNGPAENQVADTRTISVPDGVVIPVQLDRSISSATARVGQTFTASIVSRRLGDSEFPAGTKIEGRIVEARPSQNNQPGVLDFDWTGAVLPDGSRIPINGELTSLDNSNVQMTGGRIVAKGTQKDDHLKVIGVGAGAGYVLGRVLRTRSSVTTILGAAGGYLFGRSRDRKADEANIAANTTVGVRLIDPVRYADTTDYFGDRSHFLNVSNDRNSRYDSRDYGFDDSTAVPNDDSQRDSYTGAGYDYSNRLSPNDQSQFSVGDITADGTSRDGNVRDGNGRDYDPRYNDGPQYDDPRNTDPRYNDPRYNDPRDNRPVNNDPRYNDPRYTDPRYTDNRPVNNDPRYTDPRYNNGPNGNRNDNVVQSNGNPRVNVPNDVPIGPDKHEVAGVQQISIPSGTVVPVTVDKRLSSATAKVGQTFTATVNSERLGDSEFPAGTKIEGRVTEATPQNGNDPGTLDLEFRSAVLPDGTRVPLRGVLISLDDKTVQTQGGRIVAKSNKNNSQLKVIGVGAAAGFVVGRIINKDGILPSLLGALGGYLYSTKNGDKPAEAVVPEGARLGMRLRDDITYSDTTDYQNYRAKFLHQS